MRFPTLLVPLAILGSFLVLAPAADAKLPIPSCVGVPCVSVAPPTYVGADVECHVVVNAVFDVVSCAVDGGHVSAADALCELCLGVTFVDCEAGTAAIDCR